MLPRVIEKLFILGIRAGVARFDIIHAQLVQRADNFQLVLDGEHHALGLCAIAQRRIQRFYSHIHPSSYIITKARADCKRGKVIDRFFSCQAAWFRAAAAMSKLGKRLCARSWRKDWPRHPNSKGCPFTGV